MEFYAICRISHSVINPRGRPVISASVTEKGTCESKFNLWIELVETGKSTITGTSYPSDGICPAQIFTQ